MATAFPTVSWAENASVYEVNIRQYTPEGTFDAFARHLPRLKEMGVDILWFMPVTPISKKGRKGTLGSYYSAAAYDRVNEEFGDLDSFKRLVNQIHALGLKVIIDWVANHTGLDHEWTITHPEYYKKDPNGHFTESHGWEDVIDLDYDNDALRLAMMEAMRFWVEHCDIDGFRCDMAHLVPLPFWREARRYCNRIKPLFWLAECDEDRYLQVFDCNYAWDWMHAIPPYLQGHTDLHTISEILQRYFRTYPDGKKLFFTSNHDENSWNGTEWEKYGAAAKVLAVCSILMPGMPLIYSGQELPNKKRLAFFDKDPISWGTEMPELQPFYQHYLALRKKLVYYYRQGVVIEVKEFGHAHYIALWNGLKACYLLLNYSDTAAEVPLGNDAKTFISGRTGISYFFTQNETILLPPHDFLIYYEK